MGIIDWWNGLTGRTRKVVVGAAVGTALIANLLACTAFIKKQVNEYNFDEGKKKVLHVLVDDADKIQFQIEKVQQLTGKDHSKETLAKASQETATLIRRVEESLKNKEILDALKKDKNISDNVINKEAEMLEQLQKLKKEIDENINTL
jgi:hypothetical protein